MAQERPKMSGGDRLLAVTEALGVQLRRSPRAARAVAFGIDYLLAGLLSFLPEMLAYRVLVGPETFSSMADFLDVGYGLGVVVALVACSLALSFAYYVLVPAFRMPGQTPGKRLTHLEVVMLDGSRASLRTLAIRWLVLTFVEVVATMGSAYVIQLGQIVLPRAASVYGAAGMVVSTLSALYAWMDNEHRALHDLVAGTWVYQDQG